MKREEAIKELKTLREDYWDDDGYGHETKQYDDAMLALDMAIKALEQQDRIAQIIDDCDLEAWEVLEMIKEVVRK